MIKTFTALLFLIAVTYTAASYIKIEPPSAPFSHKTLSLSRESIDILPGGIIKLASDMPNLRIRSVTTTEERSSFLHITIDYEYYPIEGVKDLFVGGNILQRGMSAEGRGWKPGWIQAGRHTTLLELSITASSSQEVFHSDAIQIYFYPRGGSSIHSLTFNFKKNWCKNSVSIVNAYRYCRLPSESPKTELQLSAAQLMGPDSSSQQLAIINTKANKNYPNVSSPVIIEPRKDHQISLESGINKIEDANLTFDFGLSDWKFDPGIEFAPNSGINGTGAIRFAAKAYVPERPNSWRTAKAFLCLPAVNIDAVSIEASIKLEDIPQNTSAHQLSLTWFKSENCQSGGQHGGYAYIEKKLGWRKVILKRTPATLGAKSFQITLSQNQTRGQKNGMDNQTFFEKYSGKKDGVPDPVPALWDNIKIGYTETPHNAPSIENSQSTSRAANTKINLLKNPSFDKTTAGWQRVSKKTWRQNVGGRSSILETQIESTSGGSGRSAFMQCINLEPDSGQVFEAGIEYQNVPGYTSGGGAMRFTWYEKYGCKGKYQGDKNRDEIIAEATGWVPLIAYNLERPNGATSVQMELIHTIDKAGDRRVWWDNAYFYSLR